MLIYALYKKLGNISGPYYDLLDEKKSLHSEQRYATAILMFSFYLETNPHRTYDGWQALTWKRLRKLFRADDRFIRKLRHSRCRFFKNKNEYCHENGICKGARLYADDGELFGAVIDHYLRHPIESELVNYKGEPFNPQHVAKTPRGKDKPLTITNLPRFTPIHTEALTVALSHVEQWLETGSDHPHPSELHPKFTKEIEDKREEYQRRKANPNKAFRKFLQKICKQMRYILIFKDTGVPNAINMAPSGRLYGPMLQTLPRVVRKVALHGCYCFDFDACHHRIFQHHARLFGMLTPYLDEYLLDKNEYRATLAEELGVEFEQAKEALIAIAFGAGIQRQECFGKPSALVDILGVAAFEQMKHAPRVDALKAELEEIGERLLDEARIESGNLFNVRGLALPLVDEKERPSGKAKRVAHLVQGIESQLLKSAVSAHSRGDRPGKESVVLVLHDGWVTRHWRDPEKAARAVENGKAGIAISVSSEHYNLLDLNP